MMLGDYGQSDIGSDGGSEPEPQDEETADDTLHLYLMYVPADVTSAHLMKVQTDDAFRALTDARLECSNCDPAYGTDESAVSRRSDKSLGVTRERVRQIKSKALRKLRRPSCPSRCTAHPGRPQPEVVGHLPVLLTSNHLSRYAVQDVSTAAACRADTRTSLV